MENSAGLVDRGSVQNDVTSKFLKERKREVWKQYFFAVVAQSVYLLGIVKM